MTLSDLTSNAGALWLAAAVLLGAGELLVPGVFLVFLAVAAAITGLVTLVLPDLPLAAQFLAFAVWTGVTVMIGKRWYQDYPVESSDPLLNDRGSRLIGEIVVVTDAIAGGHGRVRIGDGTWAARGVDVAAGAAVRIVGIDSGVVLTEPMTLDAGDTISG